jgi:hypothetical protein
MDKFLNEIGEAAGDFGETIFLMILATLLLVTSPMWLPFYIVRRFRRKTTGDPAP